MLVIPVAFISGLLFGLGLLLSGLVNPARMLDGFDLAGYAAGKGDPSLAIVTLVAVLGLKAGFRHLIPRDKPVIGDDFVLPAPRTIGPLLLAGSALLGLGWGLAGYSPASAVASLLLGRTETGIFVLAMLGGMAFFRLVKSDSP